MQTEYLNFNVTFEIRGLIFCQPPFGGVLQAQWRHKLENCKTVFPFHLYIIHYHPLYANSNFSKDMRRSKIRTLSFFDLLIFATPVCGVLCKHDGRHNPPPSLVVDCKIFFFTKENRKETNLSRRSMISIRKSFVIPFAIWVGGKQLVMKSKTISLFLLHRFMSIAQNDDVIVEYPLYRSKQVVRFEEVPPRIRLSDMVVFLLDTVATFRHMLFVVVVVVLFVVLLFDIVCRCSSGFVYWTLWLVIGHSSDYSAHTFCRCRCCSSVVILYSLSLLILQY